MVRLPQPGSDAGQWGTILNEFLSQSHDSQGLLKEDSVGAAQLQTDAVTAVQLASGSVVSAAIADNAITEDKLDVAVQEKLNTSAVQSATATTKGIIQLSGDLGGTSDLPTVPGLVNKADVVHAHTIADVTNLQTTLDAKAASMHTHVITDTTGLQAALDGKAASVHAHVIADTAGLQAALDSKQPSGLYAAATHLHTVSQVSDLTQAVQDTIGSSLVAGTNVTITHNETNGATTIAATPGAGVTDLSTTITPTNITIISSTGNDAILPAATLSDAGVMSAADKVKLNSIAANATANSSDAALLDRANHTGVQAISTITNLSETLDSKEAVLPVGTTTQYYRGDKTWQQLDKAAVGLTNVDNTTDLNKPVSTAVQTALDSKAASVHSHAIIDTAGLQAALDSKQPAGSYVPTTRTIAGHDLTTDVVITPNDIGAATAAQGAKADTALQVAPVTTVNSQTGNVTITKSDVGLSNVDNTADTEKPVSTAQQTALNLKANLASPTFTGTVSGITAAMVGASAAGHTHVKANITDFAHTHTLSNVTDVTATAAELNKLDGVTATTAQLNFLVGVTSSIQTQLNNLMPTYGTGANGDYTRFPDGTQICSWETYINPAAGSNTGKTWTFPAAFISLPIMSVTCDTTAETVDLTSFSSLTTTSVSLRIVRSNSTNTALHAIAFGRWK